MKKRTIALMMAVVMLFGVAIGGTIAWLTSKTDPVVNTFTVGDVNIELKETDVDDSDNDGNKTEYDFVNSYQMIPGTTYTKDPQVSVVDTNVDCYLFVKFDKVNNPDKYLDYTSNLLEGSEKWIKLTEAADCSSEDDNVWYRIVKTTDPTKSWKLLKGDTVKIKESVLKSDLTIFDKNNDKVIDANEAKTLPQLVWKAYAVQFDNLTVAQAWDKVDPTP